jgi:mannose-1-phosphate guanylyltransferase/phosphomannomutase
MAQTPVESFRDRPVVRHAVILAAGEGRRLRPLTRNKPKVMLSLNDRPLLEHLVRWCQRHGIVNIYVNVHHAADQILSHFGDGSTFGVTMHYLHLTALRPPLMDVHHFARQIPSTFFVLYGDVATVLDLSAVAADHTTHTADATIVVRETDHPHDSDLLVVGERRRVSRIIHKGTWDGHTPALGNVGCYVMEPAWLHRTPYTPGHDFMDGLIQPGLDQATVLAHQSDAWMLDIGTPERLARAQRDFPRALAAATALNMPKVS